MAKLTREEIDRIVKFARKRGKRPDLTRAKLEQGQLSGADLRAVDFTGAALAEANLRGANLSEAILSRADLSGAALVGADLSGADLRGARLIEADLSETNLFEANLSRANLTAASLRQAHLVLTNLTLTRLEGVDFSRAKARYTIFGAVDLGLAKGLETVYHAGPSTIGADTLQCSGGKIPAVFLRGAGLSEAFITSVAALTGEARPRYACFIGYAAADETFAHRLQADLRHRGARCWLAGGGDPVDCPEADFLGDHDKLVLVLSEQATAGRWAEQAVETALNRERQQGQTVLFPIRLDEAVLNIENGWPALIRETHSIADFSRWKNYDAYHQAFEALFQELRPNLTGIHL